MEAKSNKECKYGNNCRRAYCRLKHGIRRLCDHGDTCRRRFCTLRHRNRIRCKFGSNCYERDRCTFDHGSAARRQKIAKGELCPQGRFCRNYNCLGAHALRERCRYNRDCRHSHCTMEHDIRKVCFKRQNCNDDLCTFKHPKKSNESREYARRARESMFNSFRDARKAAEEETKKREESEQEAQDAQREEIRRRQEIMRDLMRRRVEKAAKEAREAAREKAEAMKRAAENAALVRKMRQQALLREKLKMEELKRRESERVRKYIYRKVNASSRLFGKKSARPKRVVHSSEFKRLKVKADRYLAGERYEKALSYEKRLLKIEPNNSIELRQRADCYFHLEKFLLAIEDCEKSLSVTGSHEAFDLLIRSNLLVGRLEEHMRVLDRSAAFLLTHFGAGGTKIEKMIKEEKKKNNLLVQNLADAVAKMGTSRSLVNIETVLLKHCGHCMRYQLLHVENLCELDDLDKALDVLNKIGITEEKKPELLYFQGKITFYKGNTTEAMTILRKSLKLAPDFKKARVLLKKIKMTKNCLKEGNFLFNERKFTLAVEKYCDALENVLKNKNLAATLYYNRGMAKMRLSDWKLARRDLKRAIENDPDKRKAYLKRGECSEKLKDYDNAVTDYSDALRLQASVDVETLLKKVQDLLNAENKNKNHYKMLGIKLLESNAKVIKKAYWKLAKKFHPDRFIDLDEKKEAECQFKKIVSAYEVLKDAKEKAKYDSTIIVQ